MLAGLSVVLVAVVPGAAHLLSKAATLIEPKPVALSYPVPAAKAATPLDASTPLPPLVVLLHPGVPPTHATALLLFVMSMKTQAAGCVPGAVKLLELQLEKVSLCANEYNTKFALPCRCPVVWFTSAMIPANAGAEAEVPPTVWKS